MSHICNDDDNSNWRLIPGADSASTGEAKFECIKCGKHQFRGGWNSANILDIGKPLLHSEIEAIVSDKYNIHNRLLERSEWWKNCLRWIKNFFI